MVEAEVVTEITAETVEEEITTEDKVETSKMVIQKINLKKKRCAFSSEIKVNVLMKIVNSILVVKLMAN